MVKLSAGLRLSRFFLSLRTSALFPYLHPPFHTLPEAKKGCKQYNRQFSRRNEVNNLLQAAKKFIVLIAFLRLCGMF
jgi:hypothetical protein